LWQRLRLSNSEHARLLSIAEGWSSIAPGDEAAAHALLYRIGPDRFIDRVLIAWARSPAGTADERWRDLASLPARWIAPKFPLKARDFIKRGLEKGPKLGAALAAAENTWIAAGFPTDAARLGQLADGAVAAAGARI